jgi:NAD kinase
LGYLCYFDFDEHECVLDRVLFNDYGTGKRDPNLDIRMRLKVTVDNQPMRKVFKGGQFKNFDEIRIENYHVVNEVVVDRGPSPYAI